MPWNLQDPQNALRAPARTVLTDATLRGIVSNTIVPSDGAATIPGINADNFASFALDCLWAVVDAQMEAELLPKALRAAGPQDLRSAVLAYTFLVVWADVEGPNRDGFSMDIREAELYTPLGDKAALKVVEAIQACKKDGLVNSLDLLEVLDTRLLQQLGLTVSAQSKDKVKSFGHKMYQTRVQRAIKLNLYNTFREETEGFAKLVTLLNNGALGTLSDASGVIVEVDQLTGYYKLAPLKVTFCILAALEANPCSADVLLQLPAVAEAAWLQAAVAIRVLFPPPAANPPPYPGPPFFAALATLLARGLLPLRHVLHLLSSSFDALAKTWTGSTFEAAMRTAAASEPTLRAPSATGFQIDLGVRDRALARALGAPPPVLLLVALVDTAPWPLCATLIAAFAERKVVSVAAHRAVGGAMLARVARGVAAQHAALFPGGALSACLLDGPPDALPTAEPLAEEVVLILEALGPMAFRRRDVLAQLWRVVTHVLHTHAPDTAAHAGALHALRTSIFPATCLLPAQTFEWTLAWRTLGDLRQVERCRLYYEAADTFGLEPRDRIIGKGRKDDLVSRLAAAHGARVAHEVGQLQKKASLPKTAGVAQNKEIQHSVRMMCKVIMSQPIAAAARVVELCRTFDNMGDIFVAFSVPLPLAVKEVILAECLRVCLLRNDKTLRPEQEGIAALNHANACAFLGKFVAANEALDLYVAFLYVAQGMRAQEHPSDVQLIEAIFQHTMGDLLTKMSAEQRPALSHGPVYRAHYLKTERVATGALQERALRFFSNMQRVAPPSPAVLMPLFVLLCQQMTLLVKSLDKGSRKASPGIVFQLTERTQRAVLRFLQFVEALPFDLIAPLLPTISDLRTRYEVSAECAMALLRPVVRAALQGWDAADDAISAETNGAVKKEEDGKGDDAMDAADASAGERHSLRRMAAEVLATSPHLTAGGAAKCDPRFYLLFWALELPDICDRNGAAYATFQSDLTADLAKAKARLYTTRREAERSAAEAAKPAAAAGFRGYMGGPASTANEKPIVTQEDVDAAEAARSELEAKLRLLPAEREAFAARAKAWGGMFESHRDAFRISPGTFNAAFIQECIMPRCLFSMEDAVFCAHFMRRLAAAKVPGYQHPHAMDSVCRDVIPVIRCCTDEEASNLIVFTKEIFMLVEQTPRQEWFAGMVVHTKPTDKERAAAKEKEAKPIGEPQWNKLVGKWQKRTASLLADFIVSPTVGDVCVRNSLKMISELSPQFPCSQDADRIIRAAVAQLGAAKNSPDLQQLVWAAQRALDASAFRPADPDAGNETGEEGEVTVEGLEGAHGLRGRGANFGADGVGVKRGRDFDEGRRGGGMRHGGMMGPRGLGR